MLDTLKTLCELSGASGREAEVREYIISRIKDHAEISVDPMGNIIAFVKGKKRAEKRVMADAHMDEVGIMVTAVLDSGMLRFETVGGIDVSVLLARRVVFENGTVGVISMKSVHMLSADEKGKYPKSDSLYIDIGAKSKSEALELIGLGAAAVFDVGFENSDGMILSKALDDRAGCAALIDIIVNQPEYDFYATFSVQEEIGLRGARTAAFTVDPDYAIVLEATTAADLADVGEDKKVCSVGGGAAVSFMDSSTLYDKKLFDTAMRLAEELRIPHQVKSAVSGGNNAGAIHLSRGGVKTVTISVPCRYIHSPSSAAAYADIVAVRDLAKAMIEKAASGEAES